MVKKRSVIFVILHGDKLYQSAFLGCSIWHFYDFEVLNNYLDVFRQIYWDVTFLLHPKWSNENVKGNKTRILGSFSGTGMHDGGLLQVGLEFLLSSST